MIHFWTGFDVLLTDCLSLQDSEGEKSDDNLVVDVSNEVSFLIYFIHIIYLCL